MTEGHSGRNTQGSKATRRNALSLASLGKPTFEIYETLESRIRQHCKTERDIELLIAGLTRGDLVAGFSIGNSTLLPMFCIPQGYWKDPENQEKIKSQITQRRVKLDIDINKLGLLLLNEIRRVQRALDSQEEGKPELVLTRRVFDELLKNKNSDDGRERIISTIDNVIEAFIVSGSLTVIPMVDVRGEADLREIVAASVGSKHFRAPDIFWIDLVGEIFKRYFEDGVLTKRESLVSFFETRSYPVDSERKLMTKNAMNERISLALNAIKRHIPEQ